MTKKITTGQLVFAAVYNLFWPALLFFLAGDWSWLQGWIFATWYILLAGITMTYLYFKDPELLAERFRRVGTGNQKSWDKYFILAITILFLIWMVVMPLDARRFNWSTGFPRILNFIGVTFLLLSFFFFFRSFKDNTFASPLVRIQEERGQQLVTTGVYGFVRHPMYLGALLMFLGAPFLLASYWGIAVAAVIILLVAFRTVGEERMLMQEFPNYREYKQTVKYRLIPYIW
jgi:protein-S-isoprenylcysteine O-methyltransferase Ste14